MTVMGRGGSGRRSDKIWMVGKDCPPSLFLLGSKQFISFIPVSRVVPRNVTEHEIERAFGDGSADKDTQGILK